MRMTFSLVMNSAITKADYISLGGYELRFPDGSVQFDFTNSYGLIDKHDPTIVHWEAKDFDVSSFGLE